MSCDIAYEELAAFADGDLNPSRLEEIREHLAGCGACRKRLDALSRSDALLAATRRLPPSGSAILAARRALSEVIRRRQVPEIMTLAEAAEFLRVTPDQLGEVVEELPAFELGGQIRLRRQRLLEWIEHRERDYSRQVSASWVARSSVLGLGTGAA